MSPAAAVLIPLLGALLIVLAGRRPKLREGVTLTSSLLLAGAVLALMPEVVAGARPSVEVFEFLPGVPLKFTAEPLGMLFAAVASLLWPVNSLYSIGYMRANREAHQTRYYACFAVALTGAMGVALAGNLATLFIFYELLTLSTYPLVTHEGTPEAMRAGRLYLGFLLFTSIGLFLFAILWTWQLTGTLEFRPGGILAGHVEGFSLAMLLFLYMFGIGKAALMPVHRWLPAAMVAPTPVSALLHAVAVVKAGVFTVLKVVVYVFGIDFLAATAAAEWLVWVAAATLLLASLVALTRNNLKARLAYSTISQLAYVVLGAALATSMSVIGGGLQIAMHACGKITLFFCAGAIYTATHKTEVSQLDGLGRRMPFTFGAFLIGALSVIGLPPLGGMWSKWFLILGAADAGQRLMIGVLMISSLLNVAYLMPIVARGFFRPLQGTPDGERAQVREAPLLCVLPPCLTALGCVFLFFFAGFLYRLLEPVTVSPGG